MTPLFDVDACIVFIFLITVLYFGLRQAFDVKTLKSFAVGEQKFSISVISATLVATWISGGSFSFYMAETYSQGLYFILAIIADALSFLIVAFFFVPKLKKCFASFSIAEFMGNAYQSQAIRLLTAFAGFIGTIGALSIQFKIFSSLFENLGFGLSGDFCLLVSGIIVVLYSTLGGIKSVTFTDIIQLLTFSIIIPILGFIIWNTIDSKEAIIILFNNNSNFIFSEVFNLKNPKFLEALAIFIYFLVPGFSPSTYQRMVMNKNIKNIKKSFFIAFFALLIIELLIAWIAILVLVVNQELEPYNILNYLIGNYATSGVKGLIVVSVMAMIMSTADSYLNSAAVLFSHDFCRPLGVIHQKYELLIAKLFSAVLGILAILLAIKIDNIFSLFLLGYGPYMTIVTVPFMLTMLDYKISKKNILWGMGSGFISSLVWKYYISPEIDDTVIGMSVNLLTIIIFQLLFTKNTKDDTKYNTDDFKKNNLAEYCKRLFSGGYFLAMVPNRSLYYFPLIAIYFTISLLSMTYSSFYSAEDNNIIHILQFVSLATSSAFFLFPLWSSKVRSESYKKLFLLLGTTINFVTIPYIFSVLNTFGNPHITIFIVNAIMLCIIVEWRISLYSLVIGLLIAMLVLSVSFSNNVTTTLNFEFVYFLVLISSISLILLKPQQEYLAATEEKAEILGKKSNHLSARVEHQEQEIKRLSRVSDVILNNVNHELRLPITGVINFSEMIDEQAQKLGDEYIQMLSRDLNKSSLRLSTMMLSMLDLATFNARKIKLKKEKFDISQMVRERIELCKKIYLEDKPIDFKLHLQSYLPIVGDKNYLMQVIDNLITNSINYSDGGVIDIRLYFRVDDMIEFAVIDEGKGISDDELESVFRPFKVGSRTSSPAGGRGLGLSLCKAVIESHGGSIRAFSRNKGAHISFLLPS